jgi:uncharacterized protein (DUF1501 family)
MRCIECEEIELARVSDARPSQVLPVPHAALEGFPEGRTRAELTRRRLLQLGVAGFASVYGAKALGWDEVWESVAQAAEDPPPRVLVLLYLAGGNDGLNTLVPVADWTSYHDNRGTIGRTLDGANGTVKATPLAGDAGQLLAFANPLMAGSTGGHATYGLDALWGNGSGGLGSDLALMPAVDTVPNSLSHFDNSDVWFHGTHGASTLTTGWLGRWIDRHGSDTNPLQAISIDTALSKSIRTAGKPVCAISSIAALGFTLGGGFASPGGQPPTVDALTNEMRALAGLPAGNTYLARSRTTYNTAVSAYDIGKSIGNPVTAIEYKANSQLATKLKLAAHLIAANIGTRVITIHWGGFDTHSGQLAGQDRQLQELAWGLAAFRADLAQRNVESRVSTLVFSEFGRRVAENASAGTDHGAGGVMMAMGSVVRGGLASQWPGLKKTDVNLPVSTDFRSVYQAVLQEWLQDDDPQKTLGGPVIDVLKRHDLSTGLYKP